ncbi:MAG: formylglycine-generating enzyme family protein [Verrucomicrobiales bacterium]|nr:formylglycine-generating enzyme family protein [Verrucomicrobiales bacterium]
MGSPGTEWGHTSYEEPQPQVYLSRGFFICNHEVTQREFEAYKGTNPAANPGDGRRPVENITWDDATRYGIWLTQQEWNAGRLRSGWHYRLPTEAEWEYACRAGTSTPYSHDLDATWSQIPDYAWFAPNSGNKTHPVASRLPNPWGLYDMHGNVHEWCSDAFGPLPSGSVTDWARTGAATLRVFRGGSWADDAYTCRSAFRSGASPEVRSSTFGFRIVLAPTPQ